MEKGIILKGIASFYYVSYRGKVYECKARGKIKNQKMTPLVGDYVRIEILDEKTLKGSIEEIFERQVELLRPAVANVEQAIIVFAAKSPDPNLNLIDKMTVLAEYSDLDIVLCMNKCDLDRNNDFEKYLDIYSSAGYPIVRTSTHTNEGIEELRHLLKGKINVFAGPSGVGKSSLLNAIQEGLALQTGVVSEKIGRGKHTTRYSELIQLEKGGWVVDTPGFTSLELDFIDRYELGDLFPDFNRGFECRFHNCMHLNEPDCAIKKAVDEGQVRASRYESYKQFMESISNHTRRYK